ncbi:phosphate ABC transporter permease [Ameyamaea chiangmaiensis NBRC 103196]|uniref:Phosphate transport system permease protein PstA n=1 Tax=Ameyamaea chiangmaiensis TaxID=442969 RepID=A0A850PGC1_9PROT|nr:phosphate ABC transporter permease PstA [Ameyamaea chiangmaiensis]MBS4076632.1 phosphate ABC transporter permease PstA [Ameyamaea chiangmaiensis]NVN41689.1 phosphate ABC transporter permease PstA [Ameyamaea chiangmaiensis]GBQ65858.1 phosphate ABC transporter permease [Ameyamaea chiangmaiensis NBRC 103196]
MTSTPPIALSDAPPRGWQTTGLLAARRRLRDRLATGLSWAATALVLVILASILLSLLLKGLPGLTPGALFRSSAPPGAHGGLANAIVGSLEQTGLALLIGTPLGLLGGIFLAEYGQESRFSTLVRFVSDMLLSAPSILIGLFVYLVIVAPQGHFSGFAGAIALAILAMPIIVRTTEDMLRLVPVSMREAGMALGAPRWRVIVFLCLRAARGGVLTGILLALARVAGETAPLLFTSLGNMTWSLNLNAPMASLPVAIYQYAGSAYDDWVQLAWTAALLITAGVLLINILVRFGFRRGT